MLSGRNAVFAGRDSASADGEPLDEIEQVVTGRGVIWGEQQG